MINPAIHKAFVYKHVPTGLYYVPSYEKVIKVTFEGAKRTFRVKSNLSKTPRVYTRRQKIASIYNHTVTESRLRNMPNDSLLRAGYVQKPSSEEFKGSHWAEQTLIIV